jgi:hypothetical protein
MLPTPCYNAQGRVAAFFFFFFFFLAILCYSRRGDDQDEDLARFGDKLNMKVNCVKHPSIFFGYLLEPCIEIEEKILNFHRVLAIENLKKHMILTPFYFQ